MSTNNIWNDLLEQFDSVETDIATGLAAKEDLANKDTDSAFTADSDTRYPSQKAVKTALALKAPLASPALTGTPTAPTATAGDNSTKIATTGFVKAAIDVVLGGVSSAFDTLSEIATALGLKAPLASPALTGAPTAPTPTAGDNSTKIATTGFVKAAIDVVLGGVSSAFDTLSEIATALGLKAPLLANVAYSVVDYASVSAAITAIGATVTDLVVSTPNFPAGANCTAPATLRIKYEGQGSIALGGFTVTIASDRHHWPVRQVFTGSGTVSFAGSRLGSFRPEWWGGKPDNSTDCTTALQACIAALITAGGGTIKGSEGIYLYGGALQDTSNSNAQLVLPKRDSAVSVLAVQIEGVTRPPDLWQSDSGTIFKSTLSSGSGALLGVKNENTPGFSNVSWISLHIKNITFRLPANPTNSALDLRYVSNSLLENVRVDVVGGVSNAAGVPSNTVTEPTNAGSYGIRGALNNIPSLTIYKHVMVFGYSTAIQLGELSSGSDLVLFGNKVCMEIAAGFHPSHFNKVLCTNNKSTLKFVGGDSYITIDQLDIEHDDTPAWTYTEQTFTADSSTDIITATAHGYSNGQPFKVRNSGGTLTGGMALATLYFAREVTTNTLKVSLVKDGPIVDLTSNGTGTQFMRANGYDVDDPNNYAHGIINYVTDTQDIGVDNSFSKNGGANLVIRNLATPYRDPANYTQIYPDFTAQDAAVHEVNRHLPGKMAFQVLVSEESGTAGIIGQFVAANSYITAGEKRLFITVIFTDGAVNTSKAQVYLMSAGALVELLQYKPGELKVTGDVLATGLIKAGSTPTTLTDSAGKILGSALPTALGARSDVAFAAGNFTALGGMSWTVASGDQVAFWYCIIGKMVWIHFTILTSTVSGTPNPFLQIAIPGGFTAAARSNGPFFYSDNGVNGNGVAQVVSGGTVISLFKNAATNWTASTDNTAVEGWIMIAVV